MKKVKEGGKGVRLCLLGFYFYLDIHLPSYKYLDVNFVKQHLVRCCDSGRSSVFLYVIHRPWWIFGFECFVGCFDYSGWFVFYFGGFFGHYGDLVYGWPTGCAFASNVLYYIGKEGSNEKDHVKNPGKKRQVCYEGN